MAKRTSYETKAANNQYAEDAISMEQNNSFPLKEQELWQQVIIQAAYDAALAPTTPKARREKTKAIIWFSMQNKDFLIVCDLAGVDPLYIINGAKKYVKRCTAIHKRKFHAKRLRKKCEEKDAGIPTNLETSAQG